MFVYLDTSFLSQFAKVEMRERAVPYAEKWASLLAYLRQQVERGVLICPVSQFPQQEALLSPKIVPHFHRIQSELSKGYFFKRWMDILVHQTAKQLLIYLDRPQDINLGWDALTRENPGSPPPQFTRNAKEEVKQYAERLRKEKAPKESYVEQYEAEKAALICETFLQPIRQLQGLPTCLKSPDPVIELYTGFYGSLIGEAKILRHEVSRVLEFFSNSDLLDQIPFIHIFCSTYASLRFHQQERKSKDGDWLDVAALASALPYCSLVTTDKSMTHIVKSQGLDTKYEAEIFTPTTEGIDALLKRLEAFAHQPPASSSPATCPQ